MITTVKFIIKVEINTLRVQVSRSIKSINLIFLTLNLDLDLFLLQIISQNSTSFLFKGIPDCQVKELKWKQL